MAPQRKSNMTTSLSEAFGYYKYSETNTLGLLGNVSHFIAQTLLFFTLYRADYLAIYGHVARSEPE